MDIFEVLRSDHRHLSVHIQTLKSQDEMPAARAILEELKFGLDEHSRGEERLIYSVLSNSDLEEERNLDELLREEHEQLDQHPRLASTTARATSLIFLGEGLMQPIHAKKIVGLVAIWSTSLLCGWSFAAALAAENQAQLTPVSPGGDVSGICVRSEKTLATTSPAACARVGGTWKVTSATPGASGARGESGAGAHGVLDQVVPPAGKGGTVEQNLPPSTPDKGAPEGQVLPLTTP